MFFLTMKDAVQVRNQDEVNAALQDGATNLVVTQDGFIRYIRDEGRSINLLVEGSVDKIEGPHTVQIAPSGNVYQLQRVTNVIVEGVARNISHCVNVYLCGGEGGVIHGCDFVELLEGHQDAVYDCDAVSMGPACPSWDEFTAARKRLGKS